MHESVLRDCEDERATGQPQGLKSEAYLNSTSQGSRPEDARKDAHIHSRSSQFMNYPGSTASANSGLYLATPEIPCITDSLSTNIMKASSGTSHSLLTP